MKKWVDALRDTHDLPDEAFAALIDAAGEDQKYLHEQVAAVRDSVYGKRVFIRGLIEYTNYCKNNCYYCGLRRDNCACARYRLMPDDILMCCRAGYAEGFRTFVLQGGEDPYFTDERMLEIIRAIKTEFPDCALTLSIGEKERASYEKFFQAGADRYLLRHEAAGEERYRAWHPEELSLQNRMRCLRDLKEIGFQTGAGGMVGAPGQTVDDLVKDIRFIQSLQPQMVGIGPFLPQKDTPFGIYPAGSRDRTLNMYSIVRLMMPEVLLPATTALNTLDPNGRKMGVMAGANVVMPNLSPMEARKRYTLYDGKVIAGAEAGEALQALRSEMRTIGMEVVVSRGDHITKVGNR